MELATLITVSTLAAIGFWRSAKFSAAVSGLTIALERVRAQLTDERGSFSPLAERLEVRDFDGSIIETADGWMWAGLEASLVSTVGVSIDRINEITEGLNNVFAGQLEGAQIQVIHEHRAEARGAQGRLRSLAAVSSDPVWAPLLTTRAHDFQLWADSREVSTLRTYIFIGLQAKQKRTEKIRLSHLLKSSPWLEMEEADYRAHGRDVIRAAETLSDYYRAAGGEGRLMEAEEVRALLYRRLNRVESKHLAVPEFDGEHIREDLCTTDVEALRTGALSWADETYSQTVSMRRQPKRVICTLLEIITRNEALNFDFDLSMHFTVGDWVEWEKQLNTQADITAGNIADAERKDLRPNRTEIHKHEQLEGVIDEMTTGNEKLGVLGLSLTAYASDIESLRSHVDRLQVAMRRSEGMTPIINRRKAGLIQFFATLPCSPHKDLHLHTCLSKEASAYAALTGSNSGVPVEEATDVFLTADNRPFYWNPTYREFKSGMTAIFGGSGAGKSVVTNRQRAGFLQQGVRGLTIDVGKSCNRIVEAAGGQMVDVTDPLAARSLGFFRLRPESGESYETHELTDEGLPRDRLGALEDQLEMLALNPKRADDYLSHAVLDCLHKSLRVLYRSFQYGTPGMDDLIRVCEALASAAGQELAQRLSVYDSQSAFGGFFLETARASPLDLTSPYTAFDFAATTKNPRLMLIATLGLTSYLGRFLSISRDTPKFFDVDELHKLTDHLPVRKAIDLAIRTARKTNCHVTVASQDPDDAVREEFKAIRSSCEVWWISGIRPSVAAQSFDIGPGVVDLIGKLKSSGHHHREWCLLYPEGQVAHLKVRLGPLDGRLFMGASKGQEKYTAEEAVAHAERSSGAKLPPRLLEALHASGTGERASPLPQLESIAAD